MFRPGGTCHRERQFLTSECYSDKFSEQFIGTNEKKKHENITKKKNFSWEWRWRQYKVRFLQNVRCTIQLITDKSNNLRQMRNKNQRKRSLDEHMHAKTAREESMYTTGYVPYGHTVNLTVTRRDGITNVATRSIHLLSREAT